MGKNEPAFPTTEYNQNGGHWEGRYEIHAQHLGMSLRDYFAAKALVSIGAYTPRGDAFATNAVEHAHTLASHAYMIADMMLTVREEQEQLRRAASPSDAP